MNNVQEYFKNRVEATFSPMDLIQAIKDHPSEYIIVDVRMGPAHLREHKIKGAIEIPLSEIGKRIKELPKEKQIILYCWDVWCNTASKAALLLLENGFKVKELAGGIAAWKTMKFPLEDVASEQSSVPSAQKCEC